MTVSKQEVQDFIDGMKRSYQRIELPHGLETPGRDRSRSMEKALPVGEWQGRSYCDIGSMYGAMVFWAEDHGASPVWGLEIQKHSVQVANKIAGFRGSQATFKKWNLNKTKAPRKFDIVSMFNVLHHIRTPFWALRKVVNMTNDYLIIEYPRIRECPQSRPECKYYDENGVPTINDFEDHGMPLIMPFSYPEPKSHRKRIYWTPQALLTVLNWFGDWEEVVSEEAGIHHDTRWIQTFRRIK